MSLLLLDKNLWALRGIQWDLRSFISPGGAKINAAF
jgi:hypothetical protein